MTHDNGASVKLAHARTAELLRAAAAAMEAGRDPFETGFLVEHGVTLDECYDVSELLAIGARLVAWALENPQHAIGALTGANMQAALEAMQRFGERNAR